MLKSLSLQNFRGFSEHRIEFSRETILIGQNNAGKTTAIEALRLLSVCQARAQTASFSACPSWLDGICQGPGFRPSLEVIDFDFTNVQHSYAVENPAIIKAKLRNSNEIHIYLGRDATQVFCQLRIGSKSAVASRGDFNSSDFGNTKVMPPIGSLLPHEKVISKERLNKYLDGYLAYRHFRNQLWERVSDYRIFKTLLEETWPTLTIQRFENDHGKDQNEYSLLVREGRFPSEISWHGHGLQAWMQTIWFLSRVSQSATVVLDEPDVYLHADLQRKLIKVIEGRGFKQAIVATHSPEIIGDVPFQNVTVIQKKERVSKPAENAAQIQIALRGMGSLHSIQLSKIAQRGLLLFVEGDDKPFLLDVAYKLGSRVFDQFSQIAVQEIKGKGNWQLALGASSALRTLSGGEIQAALLLDADYMLDKERLAFLTKAHDSSLCLHIWQKKEIENYFINPEVISRFVNRRLEGGQSCSTEEIENFIQDIEAAEKQDVILSMSDVLQKASPSKIEPKTAFRQAEALLSEKLSSGLKIRDIMSGKSLIAALSSKVHLTYGINVTPLGVCKETKVEEFSREVVDFVSRLCSPGAMDLTSIEIKSGAAVEAYLTPTLSS